MIKNSKNLKQFTMTDTNDKEDPLNIFILDQFKEELVSNKPDTSKLRIFGRYLKKLGYTRTSIQKDIDKLN